jgi:maleylpyruvate isomerase
MNEGPNPMRLDWMRSSTELFEEVLGRCAHDIAEPSLLPGWTRAHVASHIARNADAIDNLVQWAATGIETQMYPVPERRELDVEEGARRDGGAIVDDVRETAERLWRDASGLTSEQWRATVRMRSGRPVEASELPFLRARELWFHAIDLNAGVDFESLADDVVLALIDDVAPSFAGRADCPTVELVALDLGRSWRIGASDQDLLRIESAGSNVLAYLSGRPSGTIKGPDLPPWL